MHEEISKSGSPAESNEEGKIVPLALSGFIYADTLGHPLTETHTVKIWSKSQNSFVTA